MPSFERIIQMRALAVRKPPCKCDERASDNVDVIMLYHCLVGFYELKNPFRA